MATKHLTHKSTASVKRAFKTRAGRSLLARYKQRASGAFTRPKRLDQIKGSLVYSITE